MACANSGRKPISRTRMQRWEAQISRGQVIRLNTDDSRAFAQALLNPRKPNKKLRAAARRYRDFQSGS